MYSYAAFADMSDKATLGGQDSSGNYSWRVDTNHNLIPGTTSQNDIGSSTHMPGNITISGNMTFQTNLLVTGVSNGGATDVETGTTILPASYILARVFVTTRNLTVSDGKAGQLITLVGATDSDTGTLTILADTKTGWSSIAVDAVNDLVTLLYIDDTYGWVVAGTNSVTVTQ